MKKPKENYGDLLGKYLVEKISGKNVCFANPRKWSVANYFSPIYCTVGSILAYATKKTIVWGSGIILRDQEVLNSTFLAVRGPQTRIRLIEMGYDVPEVYGDPALLLPNFYFPSIEKKYKIGIIPHYNDFKMVNGWYHQDKSIKVIDLMTLNIEKTTDELLECDQIISSSLHGLIVAHAYNIPAVWIKFSDKLYGDGIKFQDYLESIEIPLYTSLIYEEKMSLNTLKMLFINKCALPNKEVIEKLRNGLMKVCPFK
ncbi:MAG: polysaccharide pyruvyl transferase family protein [Lutibacter sp.]